MQELAFLTADFFPFHLGIAAVFGLLFGSFLNVCIYRIPVGRSIVMPGSHCFSCGTPIRWFHNIPLFSYIFLGGRCRYCGAVFSPRYFFIELLTGVLFALAFYRFRYTVATPVYITFLCLLVVASFTDIDHWIIPDGVSLGGAAFGILAAIAAGFFPRGFLVAGAWPFAGRAFYHPFLNAATGALVGAGLIYLIGVIGTLIFRKEAMGFGDVKLFLLIGAMLGAVNCLFVLMIGSIAGSIIGGGMILIRRIRQPREETGNPEEKETPGVPVKETDKNEDVETREERVLAKILGNSNDAEADQEMKPPPAVHHIPFGPFLALGAAVVLLWGHLLHEFFFGAFLY